MIGARGSAAHLDGSINQRGFCIPTGRGVVVAPVAGGTAARDQCLLTGCAARRLRMFCALLDELGIDRVGVLAVSAKSPVAYTFAAPHPDRILGLVSIGGLSGPRPAGADHGLPGRTTACRGGPRPAGVGSPLRRTFMNTVGQKLTRLTERFSFKTIVAGTLLRELHTEPPISFSHATADLLLPRAGHRTARAGAPPSRSTGRGPRPDGPRGDAVSR
jgi:pimeloyl-ACP methyl ester carboxylesterase